MASTSSCASTSRPRPACGNTPAGSPSSTACRRRQRGRFRGTSCGRSEESTVKVREVIRLLEDDGWFLVATKGSHKQYKHSRKAGRVTVAGKPSDDLAPG